MGYRVALVLFAAVLAGCGRPDPWKPAVPYLAEVAGDKVTVEYKTSRALDPAPEAILAEAVRGCGAYGKRPVFVNAWRIGSDWAARRYVEGRIGHVFACVD